MMEVATKEGTLWRVDSSGKWVKRWFELREDVLASYKAEDRTKLKNVVFPAPVRPSFHHASSRASSSFLAVCSFRPSKCRRFPRSC